jgi:hypothetical protein
MKEAHVLLVRCQNSKELFGVRMEKQTGKYMINWAFPIEEVVAKREKFDRTNIKGALETAEEEYPGCPHCLNDSLFQCNCGKFTCMESDMKGKQVCGWCGKKSKVAQRESFKLKVGML